ncbi:MAG: hypothetical protein UZ12_BCD005002192 [Bacteroidetes bacterium OLB12]|nr:MAG: hypothetical protein UZ12_BCD005002192 [Bacteroidetes bacterium OLB12]
MSDTLQLLRFFYMERLTNTYYIYSLHFHFYYLQFNDLSNLHIKKKFIFFKKVYNYYIEPRRLNSNTLI